MCTERAAHTRPHITAAQVQEKSEMLSRAIVAAAAAMLSVCASTASAQQLGSAFTYQGSLKTSGLPATGLFDMQFKLFSAPTGGVQIGSTFSVADLMVTGGLFNTSLDFGFDAIDGQRRWLEISVKADAQVSYTTLAPRQELSPTPYAL